MHEPNSSIAIHPSVALLDAPAPSAASARLPAIWLPLRTSLDVWWVDAKADASIDNARLCAMEHCLDLPAHPSIASVRAAGYTEDGHHWVAIDKPPMRSLATVQESVDCGTLMARARRLFEALAHLEAHGIVHGDIGPDAIAVDPGTGEALLGRYGPATHVTALGGVGFPAPLEPAFASRERTAGQPIDIRTDIYSLALTLYTTFRAGSADDALAELAAGTGPAPEGMIELFARMTARARDDRPRTAKRALAELELISAECEDDLPDEEASLSDGWRQRWRTDN